jgi:hypothetical protein
MNYRSWIPTVTGQLSFSVIGRTDWPSKCVSIASYSREQCAAIYIQERYTHDFSFPFVGLNDRILDKLFRNFGLVGLDSYSGRHYFVCIVDEPIRTNPEDLSGIKGRILCVPHYAGSKESIKRAMKSVAAAAPIQKRIENLERELQGLSLIECQFILYRTGEFLLEASSTNSNIDFEALPDKALDWYAAQAFYFMRDISHNHQHHQASSDLIIRLHKDSDSWARDVYYDMFRNIIHFKRIRTDFYITNASGLVAYSETFRNIFLKEDEKTYFIENTLLSLETAKYELQIDKVDKSNRISLLQAVTFGFVGILVSISSLVQVGDAEFENSIVLSKTIKFLAVALIQNTMTSVVLCFFIILIFLNYSGYLAPENRPSARSTMKFFHGFSRIAHGLLYIALGIVAFAIMLFSLWKM